MTISLNLTLFVQIINFLLAYLFISKFFLKPALNLFEKDKNIRDDLKEQISGKKNKILDKETEKSLSWQHHQEYYKKLMPDQTLKFNKIKFDDLYLKGIKELDKKKLEKLVHDASVILKSKVINGY